MVITCSLIQVTFVHLLLQQKFPDIELINKVAFTFMQVPRPNLKI